MKRNNVHAATADVLEILFSDRNKAYGAYRLRRDYPNTLLKAFAGAMLLLLLAVLASWRNGIPDNNADLPTENGTTVFSDKKEIETPPVVEAPKPKPMEVVSKPTIAKFMPPRVTIDNNTEPEEQTAIDAIPQNANIGTKNQQGTGDDPFIDPGDELGLTNAVEPQGKPQAPEEVFTFVESMPSFPGGEIELNRYLAHNIIYPPLAKESNIQGRVVLEFVVGKDGKLSDYKILRNIEGGCAKEAMRVLQSMPKWMPGIQNGNPVPVRITLPIVFKLD